MNYKFFCPVLAIATLLTGCYKTPQDVEAGRRVDVEVNRASLAAPETIGTLSNGTPVLRARIQVTSEVVGGTTREHFVYIVDGARVQTVNWNQTEGKASVPYTQATVQLPPTTTPDEIIKMADTIRQQQEAAEKAQWKALDKKYGSGQ